MPIFPSSHYEFKLVNDQSETLERLKRRTEVSESLISKLTDKSFIGTVTNHSFKVISADIGKGAFCTLEGIIKEEHGQVFVEINKPFKILFSILMLFPFIAFFIQLYSNPNEFNPIIILVCLGQVLVIRFFFIELFYRLLSKKSINKLADLIDTEWIKKRD